jgi:hypothetical protein
MVVAASAIGGLVSIDKMPGGTVSLEEGPRQVGHDQDRRGAAELPEADTAHASAPASLTV